jgi:hypothetical protein
VKTIILMAGLIILTASVVQAQTSLEGVPSRKLTLQKGNVLRKKATPQPNRYNVNNGNRAKTIRPHDSNPNAPRAQPIVTKPLPPVQPQP